MFGIGLRTVRGKPLLEFGLSYAEAVESPGDRAAVEQVVLHLTNVQSDDSVGGQLQLLDHPFLAASSPVILAGEGAKNHINQRVHVFA